MLELMPGEILVKILSNLGFKDIVSISAASRTCAAAANSDQIWKNLCQIPSLLRHKAFNVLNSNETILINRLQLESEAGPCNITSQGSYKQLFESLCNASIVLNDFGNDLMAEGLKASSEDNGTQTIQETLRDDGTFWSSKGSNSSDATEFLQYELIDTGCILSTIVITPFKACFQRGMPTYAPQYVSFSVSLTEASYDFHYLSPRFPILNINEPQSFNISPTLVVGGYLTVMLFGKCGIQPADSKYYTVLSSVKCIGIPMHVLGERDPLHLSIKSLLQGRNIQKSHLNFMGLFDMQEQVQSRNIDRGIIRRLLQDGKWRSALKYIAGLEEGIEGRSQSFIEAIEKEALKCIGTSRDIESDDDEYTRPSPFALYSNELIKCRNLFSTYEAARFAEQCISSGTMATFRHILTQGYITPTERLGDIFRPHDIDMAFFIYGRCFILDKLLEVELIRGNYSSAVDLCVNSAANNADDELAALALQMNSWNMGKEALSKFVLCAIRHHATCRASIVRALDISDASAAMSDLELEVFLANH